MVHFDHTKTNMREAFGVTDNDIKLMKRIILMPPKSEEQNTVTWIIQRVWIDEQLSDNAKAYMIFELGKAKGIVNLIFP